MTQFTWNIDNMRHQVNDGFVVTVMYSVIAVENQFVASTNGIISYEQKEENFIPYNQLTKDLVLQWVYESVEKQKIENFLNQQIELQKHPVVQNGLPW